MEEKMIQRLLKEIFTLWRFSCQSVAGLPAHFLGNERVYDAMLLPEVVIGASYPFSVDFNSQLTDLLVHNLVDILEYFAILRQKKGGGNYEKGKRSSFWCGVGIGCGFDGRFRSRTAGCKGM